MKATTWCGLCSEYHKVGEHLPVWLAEEVYDDRSYKPSDFDGGVTVRARDSRAAAQKAAQLLNDDYSECTFTVAVQRAGTSHVTLWRAVPRMEFTHTVARLDDKPPAG